MGEFDAEALSSVVSNPQSHPRITVNSLLHEAEYYNIQTLVDSIAIKPPPSVKYEYYVIVPGEERYRTSLLWDYTNSSRYNFELSEDTARSYTNNTLDGLHCANGDLLRTIQSILDNKNRLYGDEFRRTLWAATTRDKDSNMGIVLRGGKQ